MLLNILHRAVAVGWVYDCSQFLAGAPLVRRRLKPILAGCAPASRILDIGGGTGFLEQMAPPSCTYVCLDLELPKLRRYMSKSNGAKPLLADATRMPIQTGSIDLVACIAMAHHLQDGHFVQLLEESARVLRRGGQFLLLEPVFAPRRVPGRFLWSLDRGAYPKSADTLHALLAARFDLSHWDCFAVYHAYALGVGVTR